VLSLKESLVKQLRITFKRLLSLTVCVCTCVCVCNFTNKHMILNLVLVIKLYLGCELKFDQIVSLVRVGQQVLSAAFMCNTWLLLQLLGVMPVSVYCEYSSRLPGCLV